MLLFLFSSPVGPLSQFNSWFFRKNKSRLPRAGVWHIRFAFKIFVLNILSWGSFVTVYVCELWSCFWSMKQHPLSCWVSLHNRSETLVSCNGCGYLTSWRQNVWRLLLFLLFFPFLSTLQNTLAFVFNLTLKMSRVCKTALLTRNIRHWCTTVNSSRRGGRLKASASWSLKLYLRLL